MSWGHFESGTWWVGTFRTRHFERGHFVRDIMIVIWTWKLESFEYCSAGSGKKDQRCRWLITADRNTIEFDWTRFNWPTADGTCNKYYIEVRDVGPVDSDCQDGFCATAVRTERYCGKHAPPAFVSGTAQVQITASALLSVLTDVPLLEFSYRLRNGSFFKSICMYSILLTFFKKCSSNALPYFRNSSTCRNSSNVLRTIFHIRYVSSGANLRLNTYS